MPELTIAALTESTVEGNGVFDKLMQAVSAQCQREYDQNRIRGPEYSTVYLTGLQSAMDQAIRFLLERTNVELQEKQIELAQKQIELADKDLLLKDKNIELAQKQIEKLELDKDLTEAQVRKIDAEILIIPKQGALLDQQVLSAIQNVILSEKQVEQITAEILNIPKQGELLDAQVCKTEAEYDVLILQKDKIVSETDLLQQKLQTEKAQTQSGIADPASSVGQQNSLLAQQVWGIERDAEQKAAGIIADVLQVVAGVTDAETVGIALTNGAMKGVFDTLRAGINAPEADTSSIDAGV